MIDDEVTVPIKLAALEEESFNAQMRIAAIEAELQQSTQRRESIRRDLAQVEKGVADADAEEASKSNALAAKRLLLERGVVSESDRQLRSLLEKVLTTDKGDDTSSPRAAPNLVPSSLSRPTISTSMRVHVTKQLNGKVSLNSATPALSPPSTCIQQNPIKAALDTQPFTTEALELAEDFLEPLVEEAKGRLEETVALLLSAQKSHDAAKDALDSAVNDVVSLNQECAEERERQSKLLTRANQSKHRARQLELKLQTVAEANQSKRGAIRAMEASTSALNDKIHRYSVAGSCLTAETNSAAKEMSSLRNEVQRLEREVHAARVEKERLLDVLLQRAASAHPQSSSPRDGQTGDAYQRVLSSLAEVSAMMGVASNRPAAAEMGVGSAPLP